MLVDYPATQVFVVAPRFNTLAVVAIYTPSATLAFICPRVDIAIQWHFIIRLLIIPARDWLFYVQNTSRYSNHC